MSISDAQLKESIQVTINEYEQTYAKEQLHVLLADKDTACPVYNGVLDILTAYLSLDLQEVKLAATRMAEHNLTSQRPYVIVINSIQSLNRKLIETLLKDPSTQMAATFFAMGNTAESNIAQTYLNNELDNFTKFNKLRLQSINRLNDTNTLYLYEAHLKWFDKLTLALTSMDINQLPELNHHKCFVGKWILSEGKGVIMDETVFKEFVNLHESLHLVAKQIKLVFSDNSIDFHVLMLLLNKAELFSLAMGVELSLINNIRFQSTASKDPLTGMLNRQLLPHIFSTQFELSRAVEKSFCLIIIDLDNFKQVNDVHGHVEGDRVLQVFSNMILNNLRESDFAIRYGGEEFLLILPSTRLKHAVKQAEKLRKLSHGLQVQHTLKEKITASFGVTEIKAEAEDSPNETLMKAYIKKADQELYLAKDRGKDQVSSLNTIPE